jgi:hypothetical protein
MTRKKRCVLSSHYLRLVVRKIGPRAVLLFLDTNSKLLFGLFWHATLRWDSAPFLAAGGIVKTMGSRITPHLRPIGGFSAECAAATTIGLATFAHVPISTTHAIGGSVAGVGATRGAHSVRWQWGNRIIWAWILTFPGAAIIGAVFYFLTSFAIGHFIPAPTAQV